jgi:SOS-response transcriptional repressor LexA
MPLANGVGKAPTFKIMEVLNLGEVGAGRVVPFIPRNDLVSVVVPQGTQAEDVGVVVARGISLTKLGIYDGDKLLFRLRFSSQEITPKTICIVFIHSTGELVAKRIIRGANTLVLRASGGDIPDREVSPDDVEIRGIVTDVQRPIEEFHRGLESWNGEHDA